jgi:hypothetical protein
MRARTLCLPRPILNPLHIPPRDVVHSPSVLRLALPAKSAVVRDGAFGTKVHELKTEFICIAGCLTHFERCIGDPFRGIDLPVIVDIVPVHSRANDLRSDVLKQVFEQERLL